MGLSSPASPEIQKRSLIGRLLFGASESDVGIFYYSRKFKNGRSIPHADYKESVSKTDFHSSKRTVFVVHGWHSEPTAEFATVMRKAYLEAGDLNVFVVDWHKISRGFYFRVYSEVPKIGAILGKLIKSLVENHRLKLSNSEIVGHSVGAHIAGIAGEELEGKIGTIIGLDPAKPLFSSDQVSRRLDASDAQFVQAVHTCAGLLGVNYDVGHADYYANSGSGQPGCHFDFVGACAHSRSYYYYAESLKTGKFPAHQCDDYGRLQKHECSKNPMSKMGGYIIDKRASGRYYFETNSHSPYSKES